MPKKEKINVNFNVFKYIVLHLSYICRTQNVLHLT
jgi:hypothetical protein